MRKSIHIINPRCDAPSYYTTEVFAVRGLPPTVLVADLAIVTVAALAPPEFDVSVCDEAITPVDLELRPDFVAITGKVSQWGRMRELAAEFRSRGVTVLMGGPHVSLIPDLARPHCDVLVRGEIEEIAGDLFADLLQGSWKREYVGTKPSLELSPVPRWDLYPNRNGLLGSLQTSRGCPFECEFCDVIEYLGRKQRHKPVDRVCAELDELYKHGYRKVFLADDNFTVYRARAKALLVAIRDWNARQTDGPMSFITQVSIDAAADDEMLRMCADAGLEHVFIGIETPNIESLLISKKRQNLKTDLSLAARKFVEHGICVDGGMIVGFDGDDGDIFARQYDFAMSTPVPIFTLGPLVAPAATPLYRRLHAAGRLTNDDGVLGGQPWATNIIPDQMSRAELTLGIRWLCNTLYRPEAFEARLVDFLDTFGSVYSPPPPPDVARHPRPIDIDALDVALSLADLGPAEARLVNTVMERSKSNPAGGRHAVMLLMRYAQIRYFFQASDFWDHAEALDAQLLGAA